eukprot:TRINITY_DN48752_c0_g1_i1.p1 TRINITY_DN48752_c0_g1~~TRINITY_DN48752_c0_g1_i1.p1  ORF type:complete len:603 (-),score=82.03 TRINITY_DN48752_c0_g1_i1:273-2081(-)
MKATLSLSYVCLCSVVGEFLGEPNPPAWPSSVQVFGPENSATEIQAAVNAVYATNGGHTPADHGQFSSAHYAFLFKPGQYAVNVPVGYYTQVAGLGDSPSDVVFTSSRGVYCEEGSYTFDHGALNTFWRSAENFRTSACAPWSGDNGMLWAASQATPLRRIIVDNTLILYEYEPPATLAGYSSGGFLGNTQVVGKVISGSQQQYLVRNTEMAGWRDAVWNMVFVGTKNAPPSHCSKTGGKPYTTVEQTPVIAEKPFISIDQAGKYSLNIPQVKRNSVGVDFSTGTKVDFSQVYVASAERDTAASINEKLGQGLHVVLSPGVYNLDAALLLEKPNQVLLGLGLPSLVSANGNSVIKVGNVDGVRVAGVLLEAGNLIADVLLEWGVAPYSGNAQNPGFLHDVFARVGGPSQEQDAQVGVLLRVNSGNVVGDNLWLWRADHLSGSSIPPAGKFPCKNGVQVNGDDVTMYGLAAEHCLEDNLQWNGDRGATYFFQSELAYDVSQDYADKGYVGYRVKDSVQQHSAMGVGVYHYFRDYPVVMRTAIVAPAHLEASFVNPLTVFLNGQGTIQHILNDKGNATEKLADGAANPQWFCLAPSSDEISLIV